MQRGRSLASAAPVRQDERRDPGRVPLRTEGEPVFELSDEELAVVELVRDWVDRVQRVGNLNYPDEARRRRIGGLVVISVAVRRDGSVENTRIVQSSSIPMLDNAALRIVKLSEPFAPLPRTQDDPDVLHVTRTWQFLPGGELVDR